MHSNSMEFELQPGCHELVLARLLDSAREVRLGVCEEDDLRLIVEEVLTNVVKYSGAAGPDQPARVSWAMSPTWMQVRFEDPGVAFNPLADAGTSSSDEERCDGGMGILLVQALADSVHYQRHNGHNCLSISIGHA